MIALKTASEIDAIAAAGDVLARLFDALEPRVVPGVTTADLDRFAEEFIRSHPGATPAFKGLYGFPATLCVSVNEEVVHGIPSRRRTLRVMPASWWWSMAAAARPSRRRSPGTC